MSGVCAHGECWLLIFFGFTLSVFRRTGSPSQCAGIPWWRRVGLLFPPCAAFSLQGLLSLRHAGSGASRLSSSGPGFGWPSARGLSQARKTHVPASAGGFLTAEPPGLSSSVLCSFCCPCLALCQPFTPYEQALEVVPCSCPGGFACHRCFLKCHIHFTNKLTWL